MKNKFRYSILVSYCLNIKEAILCNRRFFVSTIALCLGNIFLLFSQMYVDTGGGGVQSPDQSNLTTHSSIPVSHYTGTPNINIPLYEIKIKGVNVPVSLSYNINNVKPNNHPGVTGLGWNLICGGSISRSTKGRCDDSGSLGYLAHEDRLSDTPDNERKFMNIDDMFNGLWYDESVMSAYAHSENMKGFDTSPDEFTFDFLGFSGKFYRNHKGEWQVASSTSFRVKHELIDYSSVRPPLNNIRENPYGAKVINKFELTAPDGVIYIFGGQSATDYSFNYFYQEHDLPKVMTWHLSEIITPESNSIQFKYQVDPPQLVGDHNFYLQTNFSHSGYQGVDFNVVMPVSLKSVSANNVDIITFNYQTSVQERYLSQYSLSPSDPFFLTTDLITMPPAVDQIFASYSQCEWLELSDITMPNGVKYKFTYNNLLNERLKLLSIEEVDANSISNGSYEFGYNSKKFPKYLSGHYDHLGFYNGSDFSFLFSPTFYKRSYGSDLKVKSSTYYNARSADNTGNFANAEILESITYPTGGKMVFEYEPHYVSGTVNYDETIDYKLLPNVINNPMYPGGLRIKSVTEYLKNNEFSKKKGYYYVSNFNPVTKTGTSSGVLSFTPTYFWNLTLVNLIPEPIDGFYIKDLQIFTSSSTLQSFSNSSGNYVGYSEVVESDEDKSGNIKGYTKYTFTNFANDIWGNSHFDEPAISRLNTRWQRATNDMPPYSLLPVHSLNGSTVLYKSLPKSLTPFTPFSSKSMERGKVTSKIIYDMDNNKKQATYFKYALSSNDYVRNLDLFVTPITNYIDNSFLSTLNPNLINFTVDLLGYFALGGAYKTYIGNYQLIQKDDELFNSTTPITTKTLYKYTSVNLLSQERMITSRNDTIVTNYRYPFDLPFQMLSNTVGNHLYTAMLTNGFLNYPIEITNYKNNKVFNSRLFQYGFHENNFVVNSVFKTETSTLISDFIPYMGLEMDNNYEKNPSISYLYDSRSNIIQKTAESGIKTTYLWGYNYLYPIAEIMNASYEEVKTALGGATEVDNIVNTINPDMSIVDALRIKLPNALITTSTYIPFVGISSKTDPRGVTTNYTYDTFNRLYLARDNNKNIVDKYTYAYQNQTASNNTNGGYAPISANIQFGSSSYMYGATGTASLTLVTGGSGSYSYSWYLKDNAGNVLASTLNTSAATFTFTCNQTTSTSVQCVIVDTQTGSTFTTSKYVDIVCFTYFYKTNRSDDNYFYSISRSIIKNPTTVSGHLIFFSDYIMTLGRSYLVGNFSPGLRPTVTQTMSYDTSGRTLQLTFNPDGSMYVKIVSGTAISAYQTINIGQFSFNLYDELP